MRRTATMLSVTGLTTAALLTWSTGPLRAATADLDNTFGIDGVALIDIGTNSPDVVADMAVDSVGRTLICGYTQVFDLNLNQNLNPDATLTRLDTWGELDTSFNSTGTWSFDSGNNQSDQCLKVAVQADGKILALVFTNSNYAVMRLNADGSTDSGFGTGGTAAISGFFSPSVLTVQADGRILLGGRQGDDAALRRLNADGSTDTSFGSAGTAVLDLFALLGAEYNEVFNDVAVHADGTIVAVGHTDNVRDDNWQYTNDVLAARYLANGTLDTSFGVGGVTQSAIGRNNNGDSVGHDYANAVRIQPDGKILVTGKFCGGPNVTNINCNDGTFTVFVMRYDVTGVLDSTFGTDGIVRFAPGTRFNRATGLVLHADGSIAVGGHFTTDRPRMGSYVVDGFVALLTATGALDTSFGSAGIAAFAAGETLNTSSYPAFRLAPSGAYVLASDAVAGQSIDLAVVRLVGRSTPVARTTPQPAPSPAAALVTQPVQPAGTEATTPTTTTTTTPRPTGPSTGPTPTTSMAPAPRNSATAAPAATVTEQSVTMTQGSLVLTVEPVACDGSLCVVTAESDGRPTITLSQRGRVRVSGDGFQPGSLAQVWLFSEPQFLGALPVAADGSFSGELEVPAVAPGDHTLQVHGLTPAGDQRSAVLGLRVLALTELPATGSSASGSTTLALLLAAVGVALVFPARRRQRLRG
jgi:uncharacterized delta-60 repeat protein/LPXTG-motif cell wall-anchored protein